MEDRFIAEVSHCRRRGGEQKGGMGRRGERREGEPTRQGVKLGWLEWFVPDQ